MSQEAVPRHPRTKVLLSTVLLPHGTQVNPVSGIEIPQTSDNDFPSQTLALLSLYCLVPRIQSDGFDGIKTKGQSQAFSGMVSFLLDC